MQVPKLLESILVVVQKSGCGEEAIASYCGGSRFSNGAWNIWRVISPHWSQGVSVIL
jgi:hypothetical protein